MKKPLFAGLLAGLLGACLMPSLAIAQSAFDGTWKIDLNTAKMPKKPDVMLLQSGMYHCKTCVPPISIKADGMDQKVSGHPYFDTMAIQVVDDHTVKETEKKADKVVASSTTTVAADGKTASFDFTDSSNTNAAPVTGNGTMTRVAKGPAGSHAISGSWRTTTMSNMSDNGLTMTYKVDGDNLNMSSPTGQSYSAKMDGTDSPYKGDPGTTSVSVKKLGKSMLQETDKRDGKVISVAKMAISANGKSMNITVDDKLHGSSMSFVAVKQ
jgi:polyisoprenoid-binding protein YceI